MNAIVSSKEYSERGLQAVLTSSAFFLLLTGNACAQWDGKNGCPGYQIGTHHFVTDRKDIHFCQYVVQGKRPYPPYQDRLSEYECWDRTDKHRPIHCTGFYINDNYAFWDSVVHDYVSPIPECPHSVPTCQDLDEVCIRGEPRQCDNFGTYMCKALDPVIWNGTWDDSLNRTIPQPKPGWCKGVIKENVRYDCPPRHVSTFAEVTNFCQHEPFQLNQTHYKCEYHGAVVCQGTIEPDIVSLPECSYEMNSCSDRSTGCKKTFSPYERQFCGAKARYNEEMNEWDFLGNVIECADRQGGKWCSTELDLEITSKYIQDEICPNASLNACRELGDVFMHASFCLCIKNHTTDEEIGYQCHHDGKKEPWCRGFVEVPKHDAHYHLIPKKHPGDAVKEVQAAKEAKKQATATKDSGCSGTGCKAGVAAALTVSVVAILLLLWRRGKTKQKYSKYAIPRDGIMYETQFRDAGAPRELEMKESTYNDNPPVQGAFS